MLTYEQIKKIFTILYLNEDKISSIKEIECKYNGFSNFGPYEDDELDIARLLTINGDGEVIIHDNNWFDNNYLIIYIAGNHTNKEYKVTNEQLITLAAVIEIFEKKINKQLSFIVVGDLDKDLDENKLDLYRKNIKDLLVNIE